MLACERVKVNTSAPAVCVHKTVMLWPLPLPLPSSEEWMFEKLDKNVLKDLG
jgi:hypothetical protein